MSARVTLGRVAGVHGVRGWIRIVSYTQPLEQILEYRKWWIARAGVEGGFEAEVLEGHAHGRGLIAQISGMGGTPIEDRDVAAAMVGSLIQVERRALPKLKKGEFYWSDLVGFEVVNEAGVPLGRIREMTSNGAQDVMVVQDGEGERLIPYVVGPIVKSADGRGRRIVVAWQPDY